MYYIGRFFSATNINCSLEEIDNRLSCNKNKTCVLLNMTSKDFFFTQKKLDTTVPTLWIGRIAESVSHREMQITEKLSRVHFPRCLHGTLVSFCRRISESRACVPCCERASGISVIGISSHLIFHSSLRIKIPPNVMVLPFQGNYVARELSLFVRRGYK